MAQTHLVKACTWLSKEFNVSYREGHETLVYCVGESLYGKIDSQRKCRHYKCNEIIQM